MRRLCLLLAGCAAFFAAGAGAQSPVVLPEPNLDLGRNGLMFAVTTLSDRSVVVGGSFSEVYDPTTNTHHERRNLARFLANGSLDLNWNPGTNNGVRSLTVDNLDRVYIGGDFTELGAEQRARIARVNGASGAVDPTWNPFADQTVLALRYDAATDAVFAGGSFVTIGGLLRARIAKLSTQGWGQANGAFTATANASVWTLTTHAGALYVGGDFTTIGNAPRNYIAKLSTTGSGSVDSSWNPSANAEVYALAVASGATGLYVGGRFGQIGGQNRSCIAKLALAATGTADVAWNPGANNSVFALTVAPNGWLYAGGAFTQIGGRTRTHAAMILDTGNVDIGWNPGLDDYVFTLGYADFDYIYVGGQFSGYGGRPASAMARFNTFGTSVGLFHGLEYAASIEAVAAHPDGGAIVGGAFTRVRQGIQDRHQKNLLKLSAAGVIDANWNPAANSTVFSLAVRNNGDVYAGGAFTRIGNSVRNYIAKLPGSGLAVADATWNPSANGTVWSLVASGDGSVFAGGDFTQVGGQTRARLAKLAGTGTGGADPVWNPGSDGIVYKLAADGNARLYAAGYFQTVGGQSRQFLARMAMGGSGAVDVSWAPTPGWMPAVMAVDASGRSYFGATGGWLAPVTRVLDSGVIDTAWQPALDPFSYISAIAVASDASIHVADQVWRRVDPSATGNVDPNWRVGVTGSIQHLIELGGGRWLVAGQFNTIDGFARRQIALLAPDQLFANGFD